MASPIGFSLKDIEPGLDPAYVLSRQAQQAFWNQAGIVGLRVKRLSLAKGLDKNGRPLAPIHGLTRIARRDDINSVTAKQPYSSRGRARVNAPPLQATGTASRTYSLLRYDVRGESVWFSWGFDAATGLDWGIVLARHARGFTQRFAYPQPGWGHVPSRDVIGLSESDIAQITHEIRLWWASNRTRFVPRGDGASEGRRQLTAARRSTGRYFERMREGPIEVTGHTGEAKRVQGEDLFRLRGRGPLFTTQVPGNLRPPPQSPVSPPPSIPPNLSARLRMSHGRSNVTHGPSAPVAPLAPLLSLAPPPPAQPTRPMRADEAARFFQPKPGRIFGISSDALKWLAAVIGLGIAASVTSNSNAEGEE